MRTIFSVCALILASCSGSSQLPPPRAAAHLRSGPPAPSLPPTAIEPSATASIERGALLAVLDAGIPRFLQRVETEPALDRGHFVGFRLRAFFAGDERFEGVDIRAGDVITRVNGSSIERPEHAFRIWQELRVASELRVEYLRAGEVHLLRYTIVDPA